MRFKERAGKPSASQPLPHQKQWKKIKRHVCQEADDAELLEDIQVLRVGETFLTEPTSLEMFSTCI